MDFDLAWDRLGKSVRSGQLRVNVTINGKVSKDLIVVIDKFSRKHQNAMHPQRVNFTCVSYVSFLSSKATFNTLFEIILSSLLNEEKSEIIE